MMSKLGLRTGFSLAEMMVVMLIISIVLAAMAPLVTTRLRTKAAPSTYPNNPWQWVEGSDTDAHSLASRNMIGQDVLGDADGDSKLIIKTDEDENHILFKGNGTANEGILGRIRLSSNSIVFGSLRNDDLLLNNSIVIGHKAGSNGATMSDHSAQDTVAIGNDSSANGYNSVAMGNGSSAATYSTALGASAFTSSTNAVALGYKAKAESYSTVLGTEASAAGTMSIALGYKAEAKGKNSIAIGYMVKAENENEIVLGSTNHSVELPGKLDVKGELTHNGIAVTSDRRLKNIMGQNGCGLDKIRQLKVFNYVYKKDANKELRIGLIAQDVQKVLPNAVKKNTDGFLTIRTDDIIYTLVNAVKQLDKSIQELTKEVKAHNQKLEEISKRLDKLENK